MGRAVRGSCVVAALIGVVGCGYPSFGFDGDGADTSSVDDVGADAPSDSTRDDAHDAIVEADATQDTPDTARDSADSADSNDVSDAIDVSDATSDSGVVADTLDASETIVADTADTSDGAPPLAGPCLGSHAFCEDFNGTVSATFSFDVTGTQSGSIAPDETDFASPPRSVACSVTSTTTAPAYAFLDKRLDAPSTTALTRIDADLFLATDTYSTKANIFKIQRWGDGHGVGLSLTTGGPALQVNGTTESWIPLPVHLPLGRWFHVRLEARLLATAGSYALYVDDMTTPVMSATGISTIDTETTNREIFNGIWAYDLPIANLTVLYDDVSMDFFP